MWPRSGSWRGTVPASTRLGLGSDFILWHYAYFLIVILLSAIIIWSSSTPPRSVPFIDALFLAASAMTEAGLNTINLSTLNTCQQFVLFFLIIIGSTIFVSAFIVYLRLKAFEAVLDVHSKSDEPDGQVEYGSSAPRALPEHDCHTTNVPDPLATIPERQQRDSSRFTQHWQVDLSPDDKYHIAAGSLRLRDDTTQPQWLALTLSNSSPQSPTRRRRHSSNDNGRAPRPRSLFAGVGADPYATLYSEPNFVNLIPIELSKVKQNPPENPSRVYQQNSSNKRDLGGTEYRAVLLLSFLVPIYLITWQILGVFSIGACIATRHAGITEKNGLNPWWVGAFNAVSAFNNSGMSLLDANMVLKHSLRIFCRSGSLYCRWPFKTMCSSYCPWDCLYSRVIQPTLSSCEARSGFSGSCFRKVINGKKLEALSNSCLIILGDATRICFQLGTPGGSRLL